MEEQNKLDQVLDLVKKIDKDLQEFKESVDIKFDAVDERFNAVDERFDSIDERFDNLETELKKEIHENYKKIDKLDKKVDNIDKRDFEDTNANTKDIVDLKRRVTALEKQAA